MTGRPPLSPRQLLILTRVVDSYIASGHPVGSKALVEAGAIEASPSTVRYELAELEALGLLGHPHTSAGRVPTDAGYRLYAEGLLDQPSGVVEPLPVDLSTVRSEVDTALRTTTEMLSQVTSLVALVTAPPLETTEIRHIEVLLLQPQVLMVVVITSTGGVTKRMFTFSRPIDPGLANWTSSYLNERLVGLGLGARMLHSRLHDPSLSVSERAFLDALAPVFTGLEETAQEGLYVEGASRLLRYDRFTDVSELNALMDMLERRVNLLGVLRSALSERDVLVRIGTENDAPALRSLALVAAGYGLPQRNLGAVSVIGPLRMDYGHAIRTVREAASQLSSFIADVYDQR